jgi:hypothetical protein
MNIQGIRRSEILFIIFSISWTVAGFGQAGSIKYNIPVPAGYARATYPSGSFSDWIQNLPLKDRPIILNYQGQAVQSGFYNVWGVVQMPLLFRSDLEQCADFAMRLWAEYHKASGKLDQLYLFDYSGHKVYFKQSGRSFPGFLKWAFANTNSYSLKKGCLPVEPRQLRPGDLFVQNERGGIGHVSVILDLCRSREGKELFLIGYSFMPAQEFHLEKATDAYGIQGWFTMEGYIRYLRDHLNFGEPVLRRFGSS